MPSSVGNAAETARWRVDGTVRVRTQDTVGTKA